MDSKTLDLKEANIKFHDGASEDYDRKWAIRFDEDMARYVLEKFELGLRGPFPRGKKILEIGCGTGFAMLNLGLSGVLDEVWGCDISQGMLDACRRNAEELGIRVHLECADAESLPYPDEEFEMVIGHAILHHLPNLNASLREIHRVLKPGGCCVIAGEPTIRGHQIARVVKRVSTWGIRTYAHLGGRLGKKPVKLREYPAIVSNEDDHELQELEHLVDIHNFRPRELCELARKAGFRESRYETEEFLSSYLGWVFRTVEGSVSEDNISDRWKWGAYRNYLRVRKLDKVLYRFLPHEWFYNLVLYLEK
jgi:ubiquinone/menaquinone biosynthesis C-methylase UbiE